VSEQAPLLRSPDWLTLAALLDAACLKKRVLTKSGQPNYQQLAHVCGLTPATLYAIGRRQQRPSRATLEKLAQYAEQPLELWLRAAGFVDDAGD
jgi:transcriptional regulator with XRE-family HTH domain